MKISTKGRYALRVMIDIAINSRGDYVPLKDIAKRQEITNKYLEQIISMLNKAGFIETVRGNIGGYKLSKKPSEYTIGDILRATEGSLTPLNCLEESQSRFPRRFWLRSFITAIVTLTKTVMSKSLAWCFL